MKPLLAPVVLVALLSLVGCSGTDDAQTSTSAASDGPQVAEEAATPPDLAGNWTQSNSRSETDFMTATIADGVIGVNWELGSEDITAEYWIGTYLSPTDASETFTWTSQRDVAATETKLMASTDDEKEFTYDDGTISFPESIQGQTATVELQKD